MKERRRLEKKKEKEEMGRVNPTRSFSETLPMGQMQWPWASSIMAQSESNPHQTLTWAQPGPFRHSNSFYTQSKAQSSFTQ